MVQVKEEKPRGILYPKKSVSTEGVTRYRPSSELAPFIEHYWIVRWDLAEPQTAETLPHPSIHVVLEKDHCEIVGVMRRRFSRILTGAGRVVGTKFRPGAFRAFVDRPVAMFTDRRLNLASVFGPVAEGFGDAVLSHDDDAAALEVVEAFFRSFRAAVDSRMLLAERVVAHIASDRGITKVDQVVDELAMPVRQLQRLFRDYVGVSPKWVIQRYRLLEAVERLADGTLADLAGLALDLGYADQAHFTRDFKKLVGRAPAEYARSAP